MNEMQYRANFFVQLLQSVVAVGTGLIVLALIFAQTTTLGDWTRPELLVVLGVFTMVGGFIGFVIEPNMGRIMSDIRQGTFDYVLMKPVDSQLLASIRVFRLWKLVDVIIGGGVVIWAGFNGGIGGGLGAATLFLAMLVVGSVMIYCVWLILTSGAFWVVRMDMLQELFTGIYRAGQYPVTVYPGWLRALLTFLIPIGFAVTVPSQAFTGRATVAGVGIALGFVVFLCLVTRLVWRAGVKNYSGASA